MQRIVMLSAVFLFILHNDIWAQVVISGGWSGTCVSSTTGKTYNATADLTQTGSEVGGTITIIIVPSVAQFSGEVNGSVSEFNFTGTWQESTGGCPEPTAFSYEISTDWNTMTGELLINCPSYGGEITYHDFVLERDEPVTTTTSSSSTSISTTTSVTPQPCPVNAIYGETSDTAWLLRNFRDNVLNQTTEGQELIKTYYLWSPLVVKAMEEDEEFKAQVKKMIDEVLPIIAK